MKETPVITVIGSINMDMLTSIDHIPAQGETVVGNNFETSPGGKGANQAVAALKLGARVNFIGRTGDDFFGTSLRNELADMDFLSLCVEPVTGVNTGLAIILLSDNDNRIVINPGANEHVTPAYVQKFESEIIKSDYVLMQFEIPIETIKYCLKLCEKYSIPVVLNPAPAIQTDSEIWEKTTYITPNETEAHQLFLNEEDNDFLRSKLIITLGNKGVKYFNGTSYEHLPAIDTDVNDTTGAGDVFNGALAVGLSEGKTLRGAVQFANQAAACSLKKYGAQKGIPSRQEVNDMQMKMSGG